MFARCIRASGLALVTACSVCACSSGSTDGVGRVASTDGAAPEPDAAAGAHEAGATSSSDGSPDGGAAHVDASSDATDDAASRHDASGTADGASAGDAGCIRPPYQTTNECTGIGKPGGPVIPSCSIFDAQGQLVCPTIPGCTVVPDPSGQYCTGDNVTCGLSDCGHICILPDWDPCYDVATGACLEGC